MTVDAEIISRLESARTEAVKAQLEAEDAEREASRKRRHAKNLMHRYERLLQEHGGQLALMPEHDMTSRDTG